MSFVLLSTDCRAGTGMGLGLSFVIAVHRLQGVEKVIGVEASEEI